MRVSSNMLTNNFLISLNKSLERQHKLQEQMTDGKMLHRPSDDPVKTIRSLRFNINLGANEQYTQHVKDSLSWMEITDGAMSDLSSLMMQAKELAVKAVAPNPDMALDAIAAELDGIINQMVEIGNTKIGDRYVFAGQMDKTRPFARRTVTAADGSTYDAVVYNGDFNKISMVIQPGVASPMNDSVNLTGQDIFGPLQNVQENGKQTTTVSVLNNLIKIKEALTGAVPSPNSNPAGGAATLIAGQDHKPVTLRIDGLDANGLPTSVSYSLDGGQSWKETKPDASLPPIPGRFVIPAVDMGTTDDVVYAIARASKNRLGDMYTLPAAGTGRELKWTVSNPAGGAVTQLSSEEHNPVTLRIDGVDPTGLPIAVSYSTNGGQSWQPAIPNPLNNSFFIPAAEMGTTADVEYAIAASLNNNASGATDTYTLSATDKVRDLKWISVAALDMIDNAHNKVLVAQTQLGVRMTMYERAEALLEKNNVIITEDVSANEDLDLARAMIDFKTSESVYRTALAVGARLMPPSLVDFLR